MAQEIIKEAAADKAAAYLDDDVNENNKSKGLYVKGTAALFDYKKLIRTSARYSHQSLS